VDEGLVRGRARVGEIELTVLTDGPCLFDGGAMFGVVPKALWSRRVQADAENRVVLGLNTLVIRTAGKTVVVETGLGDKMAEKTRAIYGAQGRLPEAFAEAGIALDSVDVVVNTHLHWDHCGWNMTRAEDGSLVPTFPRARYLVHAGEVEHGRLQLERDAVSYLAENYEPLLRSGQMEMLETRVGEIEEIAPGVAVELFPGHTAQLMAVHVESGGEHACYISDLIPTSAHLDPSWVMSYDLDPLRTIEERKRFYARAIPGEWLVVFTHDHGVPFGVVETGARGRPVLRRAAAGGLVWTGVLFQ
jgi:glyoxylase-like metal-dependent hydrolase (beta-lactamase superfamily II)